MTDHTPSPAHRAPLWMKLLLVVSLALNGLVVGAVVSYQGSNKTRPDYRDQSEIKLPAARSLGPVGRALSREDHRSISEALRNDRQSLRQVQREIRGLNRALVEAVTAEVFDRAAVEDIFDQQREAGARIARKGQSHLLDRLEQMTVEERIAFAERLKKTARFQRQ